MHVRLERPLERSSPPVLACPQNRRRVPNELPRMQGRPKLEVRTLVILTQKQMVVVVRIVAAAENWRVESRAVVRSSRWVWSQGAVVVVIDAAA